MPCRYLSRLLLRAGTSSRPQLHHISTPTPCKALQRAPTRYSIALPLGKFMGNSPRRHCRKPTASQYPAAVVLLYQEPNRGRVRRSIPWNGLGSGRAVWPAPTGLPPQPPPAATSGTALPLCRVGSTPASGSFGRLPPSPASGCFTGEASARACLTTVKRASQRPSKASPASGCASARGVARGCSQQALRGRYRRDRPAPRPRMQSCTNTKARPGNRTERRGEHRREHPGRAGTLTPRGAPARDEHGDGRGA